MEKQFLPNKLVSQEQWTIRKTEQQKEALELLKDQQENTKNDKDELFSGFLIW